MLLALPSTAFSHVIAGAEYGYFFHSSPVLSAINARLGNSVSLEQSSEFGRNFHLSVAAGWANPTDRWRLFGAYINVRESVTGKAEFAQALSLKASLDHDFFVARGMLRLWPYREKISRRSRGRFFFVYAGAQAGWGRQAHTYKFNWDEDVTHVEYAWATHSVGVGSYVEAGYQFSQRVEIFSSIGFLYSTPLFHTLKVSRYVWQGAEENTAATRRELTNMARVRMRSAEWNVGVRLLIPEKQFGW